MFLYYANIIFESQQWQAVFTFRLPLTAKSIEQMPKATTLIEAIANLKNEPLHKEEFKEFFVETTKDRGGDEAFPHLKRNLLNDRYGSNHYLFAGARGCGKSTELLHLQIELEKDGFLVVNFSVRTELEPNSLTHIDLLIATLKKLFEAANDFGLAIDHEYLKPITNWVNKVTTEEKTTKGYGGEIEAGGGVEKSFLGLFKIFSTLTARAKYDRDFTKTIHTEEEHLISELINAGNLMISEVKRALQSYGKGLLVIIEDLDKLDLKKGEEIFFSYVSRLVAFNMNTIYTFPIALYYNVQFNVARSAVTDVFVLPMIMTHNIDGSPKMEGGQSKLKELLERRMDLLLFENNEVMFNFIKYCGGSIFDLFRMINGAINFALNRDRNVIQSEDWEMARNRAIDNYQAMISDRIDGDKVIISSAQFFRTLIKVVQDPTKKADNTWEELQLRQNLCLLSYNGRGWIDVHPLVKEVLIEKKLIDAKYRIR